MGAGGGEGGKALIPRGFGGRGGMGTGSPLSIWPSLLSCQHVNPHGEFDQRYQLAFSMSFRLPRKRTRNVAHVRYTFPCPRFHCKRKSQECLLVSLCFLFLDADCYKELIIQDPASVSPAQTATWNRIDSSRGVYMLATEGLPLQSQLSHRREN